MPEIAVNHEYRAGRPSGVGGAAMSSGPLRLTRGRFSIATPTSREEREGYVCGPLGVYGVTGRWSVTHLRSGKGIAWVTSLPKARRLIAALLAFGGWEHSERWVMRHREKVRKMLRALENEP